jgi:hypothetical protein
VPRTKPDIHLSSRPTRRTGVSGIPGWSCSLKANQVPYHGIKGSDQYQELESWELNSGQARAYRGGQRSPLPSVKPGQIVQTVVVDVEAHV